MTARTIQTPAALRRDTRFQACSPGAKWVFGHLCDRREVVAEPGHDVLGTVVLIVEGLGDTPREALAPLLLELEQRRLVSVASDRLIVHAADPDARRRAAVVVAAVPGDEGFGWGEADTSSTDPRPLAVYFIQAGVGGPIKIGCSADAASRLATLQVGNPEALRLLATAPGGFAEEATLHARFAAHRLTGEWFRPTLELLAFIAGGAL